MGKCKRITLIFAILFSAILFAQNKTIVPTSGTIVFIKEEKILDKDLYLKSYKNLIPKMKKAMGEQIFLERLMKGIKTDTILLKFELNKIVQDAEMMLPVILEEKKQVFKFYNEFNNNLITKYYTVDDVLVKSKIFINQTNYEIVDESNQLVEIEENEIIKLIEHKNETKLINGYACFKVVYSYKEPASEFDFLESVITNTRELWVTEGIKCNYHPLINESEILEKYYPLEINEYSEDIKGFITTYKVATIKINQ